jgi:CO/xanthine dehydrogenase Mo-binding subunit
MEIGGGFGGKIAVYVEPVAAILSKKSGHPVKTVMSRKEVFESSGPTPGSHLRVKMGGTKNGRITAAEALLEFEAGGYPGSPVGAGAMCVFSVYDLDNVLIDGYDVVVNKPKSAAYRAPGAPNAAFAAEQVVDELAGELGMDPMDLRLKNAAKEGTRRADGPVFPRIGCVEVMEAMKNHPHYNAPLEGPNRGRGVAVGFWFNVGFESSCTISINADGTATLAEGSTDIGGTRASIAMQAAEVLSIPAESVRPTVVDTDSVGYTSMTGGSRTTYATGWAAHDAAQDVKRQMIERAAKIWEVDAGSVQLSRGAA